MTYVNHIGIVNFYVGSLITAVASIGFFFWGAYSAKS